MPERRRKQNPRSSPPELAVPATQPGEGALDHGKAKGQPEAGLPLCAVCSLLALHFFDVADDISNAGQFLGLFVGDLMAKLLFQRHH